MLRQYKRVDKHKSVPQVGGEILAISKRIMNRVMCLAEDMGFHIAIQDTDSMHINADSVKKLSVEYKKKYGKEIIGKNLGQFHNDFDDIKHNGEKIPCLGAVKTITLGKKCYVDRLVGVSKKTGELVYSTHFRMKGIPSKVLERRAAEMNMTIIELYEYLYKGESVTFDLAAYDDIPCFGYTAGGKVYTKSEFTRKIAFK